MEQPGSPPEIEVAEVVTRRRPHARAADFFRTDDLYEPLERVASSGALNLVKVQLVENLFQHEAIRRLVPAEASGREAARTVLTAIERAIDALKYAALDDPDIELVARAVFGVDAYASLSKPQREARLARDGIATPEHTFRRLRSRAIFEVAQIIKGDPSLADPTKVDPASRMKVMRAAGWRQTLADLYPAHQLLTFAGSTWPIVVFPAHPEQWRKLESVLGDPETGDYLRDDYYAADLDPAGLSDFQYHRATVSPTKWNGRTFALKHLATPDGHGPLVASKPGRFFWSLATSECLDAEFIRAHAKDPAMPVRIDSQTLPRRRWVHRQLRSTGLDPVTSGEFRSAALSVAMSVIYAKPDGTFRLLVTPRSQQVALHPGFIHVMPSGIFQPLDDDESPWNEHSIERNIYREYAEELFSFDELHRPSALRYHDLEKIPPIVRLRALIERGGADVYFTGVSVNLLTLRLEMCTLLLVHESDWLLSEARANKAEEHPLRFNYEALDERDEASLPDGVRFLRAIELTKDFDVAKPAEIRPDAYLANAAAAMALGLDVAKRISDMQPQY